LANQLVSPRGNLLLVYVEVLMRAPGPDSNPQWQLDDRRRALERLVSVRDDAALDTIGVAYDGSPQSERPLTVASELAREREAELSASRPFPSPCASAIR
jgi:hypothetical protein